LEPRKTTRFARQGTLPPSSNVILLPSLYFFLLLPSESRPRGNMTCPAFSGHERLMSGELDGSERRSSVAELAIVEAQKAETNGEAEHTAAIHGKFMECFHIGSRRLIWALG
jgi:hypothetical protein